MAVVKEMEKPQDSAVEGAREEPKSRGRTTTLPKPSNKTLTPEEFYSYTAGFSEADWAHTIIYVFRQWPRIIREPKNIEKISSPVTEEHMLETHGSGKYWLMLNDTDTDKTVAQTYPDLDSPNYPPRIDLRELDVAHEKNRTFVDHLKRMGKLTMEGDVVQPGKSDSSNGEAQAIKEIALEAMRAGQNKPGLETRAFEKMMDMMSTASSKSIEIAMGQVKQENPTAFMELMMKMSSQQSASLGPIMTLLTTLITSMLAPKAAVQDPMILLMMEQLKTAREDAVAARAASEAALQRAHEKELIVLEQKAEQGSPLKLIREFKELENEMGGGGPKDWKQQGLELLGEHLPEFLNLGKQAIGYRVAQQTQQAQPQPQAQARPAPPQQQTQPQQPQGEVKVSDDPDIDWLVKIFLVQGPMFINTFRTDPMNGGGLAMALGDMGMLPLYTRAAAMGPEKIIASMRLIPKMWEDALGIGTEAMVVQFVTDFCKPPEDDPADDPAPSPKKKGAKK